VLDRAESNIRSTQARVVTLNEAIAAFDAEIAAQASAEAAAADQKQRAATARQIHKLAAEIEDSLPDIIDALKRGHAAIEAGRFLFGTIGIYPVKCAPAQSKPSPDMHRPGCQCRKWSRHRRRRYGGK
jgi:phage gp29-like protein